MLEAAATARVEERFMGELGLNDGGFWLSVAALSHRVALWETDVSTEEDSRQNLTFVHQSAAA